MTEVQRASEVKLNASRDEMIALQCNARPALLSLPIELLYLKFYYLQYGEGEVSFFFFVFVFCSDAGWETNLNLNLVTQLVILSARFKV